MNKKILALILVGLLGISSVFAGDTLSPEPEYSPVKYYDFDLEVENEGGKLEFEWEEFEKYEKIKWWKLAFSQKTEDISYPESDSRFLGDSQDLDEARQWFDAGEYYFRLCAITYENERYCGSVIKYSFEQRKYEKEYEEENKYDDKYEYEKKEEMTVCTMEYAPVCGKKDGKYKMYSNNCMREAADAYRVDKKYCESRENVREEVKLKEKTFGLSLKLRKRINEVLEDFVERLEDRGYSDEKISDSIDVVLERLETFSMQKKYKNIAGYMMQELRLLQENYSDPLGDLESIFDDL